MCVSGILNRVPYTDALWSEDSGALNLDRLLGYSIFSLMAFIGDPVYQYLSKGFRGQPRNPKLLSSQRTCKDDRTSCLGLNLRCPGILWTILTHFGLLKGLPLSTIRPSGYLNLPLIGS